VRRTKIVATIGPATRDVGSIRRLVNLIDVFRINFSHGDRSGHLEEMRNIRVEARRAAKTVAILQDLPGPKIRVGKIANGSVDLVRGTQILLTSGRIEGDASAVSVNYPELLKSVRKGDTLHLADGVIRLRVDKSTEEGVKCTVLTGGVLSSGKGVNAPGVKMRIEFPTKADVGHLKFGVAHGVDFVGASFVRTASDVRAMRKLIPEGGPMIIAKIEKKEAISNFEEILAEADGVMVARGDLGIEVPIETVPNIQREIIRKCKKAGKPVIVATQMLVSMVNFPVPSRAEVTDVSTAILEGTDAVMLSDETTVGKYPIEAVQMLDKISRSTERSLGAHEMLAREVKLDDTGSAIARAACRLADYIGAKAIVAPTQTGTTARRVSMYRPSQPIIALCSDTRVARQLKLYMGVFPTMARQSRSMDSLFERADEAAEQMGMAKKGERIVVTSGTPGVKGTTNLIKVSVVGSPA
jgi:pyruvate kinase